MKKLLTILGSLGLIATTGTTVVSCLTDAQKFERKIQKEIDTQFENQKFADENAAIAHAQAINFSKVDSNLKAQATVTAKALIANTLRITIVVAEGKKIPVNAKKVYEVKWVQEQKQLSTLITAPALGALTDDQEATIRTAIDAKYPAAAGHYTLTGISSTGATATGTGNYQGTVTITFTVKAQLSTLITAPALGALTDNQEATIRAAINAKYPAAAAAGQYTLTGISSTGATATGTGNYQGTVTITFTVKAQLSTLITRPALGPLANNQEAIIQAAINIFNAGAAGHYTLTDISPTGATATGTGNYQGTVTITFTLNPVQVSDGSGT